MAQCVCTEQAHINELELRAAFMMLRWRLRSQRALGKRSLALLDSAVSIAVLSKKRSSSYQLHCVVRRINALELTSGSHVADAFVRSADNPADAPSRDAATPSQAKQRFTESFPRWGYSAAMENHRDEKTLLRRGWSYKHRWGGNPCKP